MQIVVRAAAVTAAAASALAMSVPAGHASQGSENAAQTERGSKTFVDAVPCASDTGFFEITLGYNSTERFTDRRGHFTETGTFSAVPVTPTAWTVEEHDGHEHLHVTASEPRPGATYAGRYTIQGTFGENPNTTHETFTFRVKGASSDGEPVQARALYHQTTVDGETRSLLEREVCG